MSPQKRNGFTLIELLIVMAIIGILIGLLFPAIKAAIEGARRAQAVSACKQIETAMKSYFNDYGKFPLQTTASSGDYTYPSLLALMNVLRAADSVNNPRNIAYLDIPAKSWNSSSGMIDPWDNPYQVRADWDMNKVMTVLNLSYTNMSVAVWSKGPDGSDGNDTPTVTHTNNLDNATSWGK